MRYQSPNDRNAMDRFFTWLFPEAARKRDDALRVLDECIAEAKKQNVFWEQILDECIAETKKQNVLWQQILADLRNRRQA